MKIRYVNTFLHTWKTAYLNEVYKSLTSRLTIKNIVI